MNINKRNLGSLREAFKQFWLNELVILNNDNAENFQTLIDQAQENYDNALAVFNAKKSETEDINNAHKELVAFNDGLLHILKTTREELSADKEKLTKAIADKDYGLMTELEQKIDALTEKVADISDSISAIRMDISDYKNQFINSSKSLLDAKNKLKLAEQKLTEMKTKVLGPEIKQPTLEDFENFLKDNKLSTTHSAQLFKLVAQNDIVRLDGQSFSMRKDHPIRHDLIGKKIGIPAGITGATLGTTLGIAAAGPAVGATTVAGIIPVMATPAGTITAGVTIGVLIGSAVATGVVIAKDKITKHRFNKKYGKAKENIKEYLTENSCGLFDAIKKMERDNEVIADHPYKHFITLKNSRNRMHYIASTVKDLVEMYSTFQQGSNERMAIKSILKRVDEYIRQDIESSKLHALLTCDKNGEHSHVSTIEHLDIYAKMRDYFNEICGIDSKTERKLLKQTKKQQSRNMKFNRTYRYEVAEELLNGASVFEGFVKANGILYTEFADDTTPRLSESFEVEPEIIHLGPKTEQSVEQEETAELGTTDENPEIATQPDTEEVVAEDEESTQPVSEDKPAENLVVATKNKLKKENTVAQPRKAKSTTIRIVANKGKKGSANEGKIVSRKIIVTLPDGEVKEFKIKGDQEISRDMVRELVGASLEETEIAKTKPATKKSSKSVDNSAQISVFDYQPSMFD